MCCLNLKINKDIAPISPIFELYCTLCIQIFMMANEFISTTNSSYLKSVLGPYFFAYSRTRSNDFM